MGERDHFSGVTAVKAADWDHWSQIYPRPTNQGLRDVASDGTNRVTVGTAGTVLVSSDGTNWAHSREITFADGKKLFFGPPAGTGDGGATPAVKVP